MAIRGFLSIMSLGATFSLVSAQDTVAQSKKDTVFHIVQEGETLRSISEDYFNGLNRGHELIQYNENIKDHVDVRPGVRIAIPMKAVQAEKELLRAMDALTKLHAMNGVDHAPENYRRAASFNKKAHEAMERVSYDQARRFAGTSIIHAEDGIKNVRKMQPKDVSAELVWSSTPVKWLPNGKKDKPTNWKVLPHNSRLMAGDRVRTDEGVHAVLVFHDKTRMEMKGKTEVELIQVSYNQMDGQADSEIEILAGEIYSEVTPAKNKAIPNYRVRYGNYSIAFRGTHTRLYSHAMSVTEGEVKFRSGKFEGAFPQGQAALMSKNGVRQVNLIHAPHMQLIPREFAQRTVPLFWGAINGAITYEIEVAEANAENSFINLAATGSVAGNVTNWKTEPLETGKYIWRVTGVDHQKLLGMPSSGEFTVVNKLGFDIQAVNPLKGKFTTKNNRLFVRPVDIENSIDRVEVSINGGEFEPLSDDGIPVGSAGTHQFVFRSHAFSGEVLSKKKTILVDDMEPKVKMVQSPIHGSDDIQLSITATDDYNLENVSLTVNGKEHTHPSKLDLRVPAGSSISYHATDKAGNQTPAHRCLIGFDGIE